ncbi:MAG TPA: hypothetical protein VG245_07045 [Candidatus Dormibacteraeota bacterium]|jgi:hypothetical protein|nr:hypothetical protein [Candidatus Dormibacteraeota bacterium]
MEESINEFRDKHALLLTEIKRLTDESADDTQAARTRELRSILRVVARSFLRENVDPSVSEAQLQEWLGRLDAAA